MPDPAPTTNRALALAKTVAKFVAAWAAILWLDHDDGRTHYIEHFARDANARIFAGFPAAAQTAEAVYDNSMIICGSAFAGTVAIGSFLAVLGALVRTLARARVRAGKNDFLERPRAWTTAHPKATRALLASPIVLCTFLLEWPGHWELEHMADWMRHLEHGIVPYLLAAWGVYAMEKKGVRELLAPTIAGAATRFEISPDEIAFDAVAVTRRTLAIVAVFTALMVAIPFLIAKLPLLELYRHGEIDLYLFGGYIAFAASGAYAFRKASRIAVGVDGVHVHGTSGARFFAYRDLEAARTNGSDLELVRHGRAVLRLQLHGADAARRDAVLARIRENIDRVREGRGAMAAQLVASSSKDDLARVAHGAGDYRMATLTREQLWALVEGPEIEASARKAAAEALVRSGENAERARLRVAAERCAEPQVRVALEELAAEESSNAQGARAGREADLPPPGR